MHPDANPRTGPSQAADAPWTLHDATRAMRRAPVDAGEATTPVKIVDIEVPLASVFNLWVQIAIVQVLVAVVVGSVVVAVLMALGWQP